MPSYNVRCGSLLLGSFTSLADAYELLCNVLYYGLLSCPVLSSPIGITESS